MGSLTIVLLTNRRRGGTLKKHCDFNEMQIVNKRQTHISTPPTILSRTRLCLLGLIFLSFIKHANCQTQCYAARSLEDDRRIIAPSYYDRLGDPLGTSRRADVSALSLFEDAFHDLGPPNILYKLDLMLLPHASNPTWLRWPSKLSRAPMSKYAQ